MPGCDSIIPVNPGSGENGIGKLGDRGIFFVLRKHELRPGRRRIGNDVPVDVEIDNPLERRLVGNGVGLAGARNLRRVLARKQHRIVGNDGKPRRIGGERLRHSLIEPIGRAVETLVLPEPVTQQGDGFVRQDRGHEARAGLVGMLCDLADQGQCDRRRRHEEILSALKPQSDLDGDLRQPVEFHGIDRC